jgi:DNA-binding XRE family transcriptional regulator
MEITLLNGHDYSKETSVLDVHQMLQNELFTDMSGLRISHGEEEVIIKLAEPTRTFLVTVPPQQKPKKRKAAPCKEKATRPSKAERLAEALRKPPRKTKDSKAQLRRKGTRLRKLREKKGWTQGQLARKAKLNPSIVCRMEQGKLSFEGKCGAALAVALDISWWGPNGPVAPRPFPSSTFTF